MTLELQNSPPSPSTTTLARGPRPAHQPIKESSQQEIPYMPHTCNFPLRHPSITSISAELNVTSRENNETTFNVRVNATATATNINSNFHSTKHLGSSRVNAIKTKHEICLTAPRQQSLHHDRSYRKEMLPPSLSSSSPPPS